MNVTIRGEKQLFNKLNALDSTLRQRAIKEAGNAGAEIFREAVKSRAPKRRGKLADSISLKIASFRQYVIELEIGPTSPGAWYAHLVENGTQPRTQKSGKSTGSMPAKPFLRPAFDETKDRVEQAIIQILKRAVE